MYNIFKMLTRLSLNAEKLLKTKLDCEHFLIVRYGERVYLVSKMKRLGK